MLQTLFGLKGRLRRRDWWLWTVVLLAAEFAIRLAVALLLGDWEADPDAVGFDRLSIPLPAVVGLPLSLLFLWPHTAIGLKRFHDGGFDAAPVWFASGVTAIAALPLPFATWDNALNLVETSDNQDIVVLATALALVAGLSGFFFWLLYRLGIRDGQDGDNRWGPSPKAAGPAPAHSV